MPSQYLSDLLQTIGAQEGEYGEVGVVGRALLWGGWSVCVALQFLFGNTKLAEFLASRLLATEGSGVGG